MAGAIGFLLLLGIVIASSVLVIHEVRQNRYMLTCMTENGGNIADCKRRFNVGEDLP